MGEKKVLCKHGHKKRPSGLLNGCDESVTSGAEDSVAVDLLDRRLLRETVRYDGDDL